MTTEVLLSCSGNSCRSPIAMALASQKMPYRKFDSGGYWAEFAPRPVKTLLDHAVQALLHIRQHPSALSLIGYQNKKLTQSLIGNHNVLLILGQKHQPTFDELDLISPGLSQLPTTKYWSDYSVNNFYVPDPWDIDGFDQWGGQVVPRAGAVEQGFDQAQWITININGVVYNGGSDEAYQFTARYLRDNIEQVVNDVVNDMNG